MTTEYEKEILGKHVSCNQDLNEEDYYEEEPNLNSNKNENNSKESKSKCKRKVNLKAKSLDVGEYSILDEVDQPESSDIKETNADKQSNVIKTMYSKSKYLLGKFFVNKVALVIIVILCVILNFAPMSLANHARIYPYHGPFIPSPTRRYILHSSPIPSSRRPIIITTRRGRLLNHEGMHPEDSALMHFSSLPSIPPPRNIQHLNHHEHPLIDARGNGGHREFQQEPLPNSFEYHDDDSMTANHNYSENNYSNETLSPEEYGNILKR